MSEAPERKSKPPVHRDDAVAVLKRLRENGHVAYFAGGCVRDMLLGLKPSDFDVATDAPPDRVRQLFSNTQAVGAKFGVILVKHRQSTVEVATFRSEGAYLDGRRPSEVRFTTAEEDAQRRDFTINGMFYDPVADQVVDFVGGQKDLTDRVLRAIGNPDERFREDHLRLLRAVRFAARFQLTIEPATASGIARHAAHLKAISPERIAEELRLMLAPETRLVAWPLLWEFRLTQEIFRFVPGPRPETYDPSVSLPAKIDETMMSFGQALAAGTLSYQIQANGDIADVLQSLTSENIRKVVGAIRQALRISNEESDEMKWILSDLGMLLGNPAPGVAAMKRFLARPTAAATQKMLQALFEMGQHRDRMWIIGELATREKEDCSPEPLLTGEDLIALGMSPGPAFKNILNQVYDAQLENRIQTREEAMAMARSLSGSSPSTQ